MAQPHHPERSRNPFANPREGEKQRSPPPAQPPNKSTKCPNKCKFRQYLEGHFRECHTCKYAGWCLDILGCFHPVAGRSIATTRHESSPKVHPVSKLILESLQCTKGWESKLELHIHFGLTAEFEILSNRIISKVWTPPDLCLPRCVFSDCPCIW